MRFSWKLRTGMLAVAVVAIVLGATMSLRRVNDFQKRAADHAVLERRCLRMADSSLDSAASIRSDFETLRRRHREEREKLYDSFRQRLQEFANDPDSGMEVARKIAEREAAMNQQAADEEAEFDRQSGAITRRSMDYLAEAKRNMACAAYHADLRRKYERATSHFWETVPPDPPAPGPPLSFETPGLPRASPLVSLDPDSFKDQ